MVGRQPHCRSSAVAVGICALILAVAIMLAGKGGSAQIIPDVGSKPLTQKCWIFTHMNKSGGSSVKRLLEPFIGKYNNVSQAVYDTRQWIGGVEYAKAFIDAGNTITWGGYTEALRPYGVQDCKWFTMFRHPISRVVSAFFYCKRSPRDQLCAGFRGKTSEDDLLGFTKHWGNYGLMQFVLAFVTPEDIASNASWTTEFGDNVCFHTDESGRQTYSKIEPRRCPGWYLLKLFIERRSVSTAASGVDNSTLNQARMHQFLQPTMDLLSNKYTAVGILEQWDTSLKLFQSALELPNMNWEAGFRGTGIANANSAFQGTEQETLAKALRDPRIREVLWLDILLYDHAVGVFNTQVAEYNIQ